MKRKLLTAAAVAGFLVHGVAAAQQANTATVTRNSGATNPVQADFPPNTWNYPPQISARQIASGYNDHTQNRMFLETLRFKRDKNCTVKAAQLSVRVKAGSRNNDTFGIAAGGQAVYSTRIWGSGDNPSQGKTLNYNLGSLSGNILSHMNSTGRLSFYVEDDTTVQSARLTVKFKCSVPGPGKPYPGGALTPMPVPKNMPGEHFQCYAAKPSERRSFERITIRDQFGKDQVVLGRAVMLCNPSAKVHNKKRYGIRNAKRHLVCYNIVKQSRPKARTVIIQNQFEGNYLNTAHRQMFCVPSHKKHK